MAMWMNSQGLFPGSFALALTAVIGLTGGGGALIVALVVWLVMLRRR
jgi:hypothetical protein